MARLLIQLLGVVACCLLVVQTAFQSAAAQEPGPSPPSPPVPAAPGATDPPADSLSELVVAAPETPAPSPAEELAEARIELRLRAQKLEEWVGIDGQAAATAWKAYLNWDKLAPQLSDGAPTDANSRADLDDVLQRLRDNKPGLEGEPFTNLAAAIERYSALVPWAKPDSEPPSEPVPNLDDLYRELQQVLAQHAATPTTETARRINEILHAFTIRKFLPDYVAAIHKRYAHPNGWLHISARLIARFPTEPVNSTQPVQDCILGTTICGEALTCGRVKLGLCNAADHIELAASLTGQIYSRTTGYHAPVKIQSRSTTPFSSVKRVSISNEAFTPHGAIAHADTNTTILSIVKTGNAFLHKLVVNIAWRRALQQKEQAEAIASRHAERTIEARFNERLDAVVAKAYQNYDQKIRNPLQDWGLFPDAIGFSSTTASARIASTYAKRYQLGAPGPPPAFSPANDVTVQIHESAINNAMPLILRDVELSSSEEAKPRLSGDVPDLIKSQLAKSWESASDGRTGPPWSVKLDEESPATIHFADGKVILRLRASKIRLGEKDYKNWDILGTYSVVRDGEKVLFRRTGAVNALPAAFDELRPRALIAEEASARRDLATGINASESNVLPPEFSIPPLRLPDVPDLGKLRLNEIVLGNGWLTVGWALQ